MPGTAVAGTVSFVLVLQPTPAQAKDLIPGEPVNGLEALLTIPGKIEQEQESVPVELELRNVSSASFSLYRDVSELLGMPGFVRFLVHRVSGGSLEIMQEIDYHDLPSREDYVRLQPGESLKKKFTMLAKYYEKQSHSVSPYEPLEPGLYELHLEVQFSDEGQRVGIEDAWIGTVFSNSRRFEVLGRDKKDARTGFINGLAP